MDAISLLIFIRFQSEPLPSPWAMRWDRCQVGEGDGGSPRPSPALQCFTIVVFPVVKPRGAWWPPARTQHSSQERGPSGRRGRLWANGSWKDAENFKPLEY